MATVVAADASDLHKLAGDFAKAIPVARVAADLATRAAAEIVLRDARARAGYSRRIPGSGRVRSTHHGAEIIFGGPSAPDAAAIENRGKGFVRHPVYGNRGVWTAKHSHPPFLAPAIAAYAAVAPRGIGAPIVDAAARAITR